MKRSYVNDWKVDDSPFLSPDEDIEVKCRNIYSEDSGTDESGVQHLVLLRANVHTWIFSYSTMTTEEYQYMMGILRGKDVFTFTYPEDDEVKTCSAYWQELSSAYRSKVTGMYTNVSFQISER